jgi:HSP20 family protein
MLTRWTRWNPIDEISAMQREFGSLFARLFGPMEGAVHLTPPMEAYYLNKNLFVRVFLPGVDPAHVDVTIKEGMLTVHAERKQPVVPADDLLFSEIGYGNIERTIRLPEGLKADHVKATYHNGVFEVVIPLVEAPHPYKVPIEVIPAAAKEMKEKPL